MITLGMVGFVWITGNFSGALNLVGGTIYDAVNDYLFGAMPMFLVMGLLINLSESSQALYDSASVIFRRLRGGIAIATVVANAIFAAVVGVSLASLAVFGKVAIPQMKRLGYNYRFALGTVAGSSILGMLIPPSVLFIVYGILSQESIGKLFMAGFIPGIILATVYSIGILLMVRFRPHLAGGILTKEKIPWRQRWRIHLNTWSIIAIMMLVLGGIYSGFFTATEAGAIGALGALVLTLIKKKLTFSGLWSSMFETGYTISAIYFLIIGAQVYSKMLAISGLPAEISKFVISMHLGPMTVIWFFVLVMLFLGCIIDSFSILLLCMPLMLPVIKVFNLDFVWFGVVTVIVVEMGLLTPPFGMVAFALPAILDGECTVEDVFSGVAPFLVMMFLVLTLIIFVPTLSTWLPNLMK